MRRLRWIAIKSAGDPAAVVRGPRAQALARDRSRPPDRRHPDDDASGRRTRSCPQRLAMSLATMFAGIALFLSMLGLYGVLVERRRPPHSRDRHPHGAGQHRAAASSGWC